MHNSYQYGRGRVLPGALAVIVLVLLMLVGVAGCDAVLGQEEDSPDSGSEDTSDAQDPPASTDLGDGVTVNVVSVVTGLDHPWGFAFLPDGDILVTERPGNLVLVESPYGSSSTQVISDPPNAAAAGQGGLLDIALHPNYEEPGSDWIYFTYAKSTSGGYATALGRGRLSGTSLTDREELFVMSGPTSSTRHFGSRIVFGDDGYLYMSIGDRGARDRAQDPTDHAGSTLRLTEDGTPAPDNPFDDSGERAEIYSIGHRNAQGMTVHPETGAVWQNEHGPDGGDEVNVIREGANYGWPVITYGTEYAGGPVGDGSTEKAGMEQPIVYWVPTSIAPSGMTFYTGDRFPRWRGNLFVGALAERHLRRLVVSGKEVLHQEELLADQGWRIRQVKEGPRGYLWLITDADNGGLYRLEP